ncbi:MAG: hypothetical protein ACLRSW_09470 [Christensenellaceae bacterium]
MCKLIVTAHGGQISARNGENAASYLNLICPWRQNG